MIIKNIDFNNICIEAGIRAKSMVDNGLYSRFNLSEGERIEKAKLGCIGELAFEQLLIDMGFAYEVDREGYESRNTDEFDFLIHDNITDVKVAKKSTPNAPNDKWTYGYPAEQHPKSKNYVFIGWVDFEKREIGFYGWITGEKIASYPVTTRNSFAGYKYLTPNHEFSWGDLNKDIEGLLKKLSSDR